MPAEQVANSAWGQGDSQEDFLEEATALLIMISRISRCLDHSSPNGGEWLKP